MNIAKLHAEGRKFRTVQGRPVRILCTDKLGENSIVYLEYWDGVEFVDLCRNDGGGKIEPVPVEREGWVIIAQGMNLLPTVWKDEEAATGHRDRCFQGCRIARITWTDL